MTSRHPFDIPVFDRPRESSGSAGEQHDDHRSIARMRQEELLAPQVLDQRGLIHATMDDSRQMNLVRELRTNVLTRSAVSNPILMVTGVSSGCGASYLARNLAASIALDEDRTALLMECDLRDPKLAEQFDIPGEAPGLLDLFGGGIEDLSSIIHSTGVERLRLIPVGQGGLRGPEHFASVRMRALVKEIRNRYEDRYIVIDAPPVLGAPDARILSEYADLIILVVGEGRHRPEMIRRAADMLPRERFAGVAFNHLP